MADLKVEYIEIEKLKVYKDNPRFNDNAIEPVKLSIQKFGMNNPILVDKNYRICAGHTRLEACRKLGLKKVPIIKLDLNDIDFRAYNISDNKTASLSLFNEEKLSEIIKQLQKEDGEILNFLGFQDYELEKLLMELNKEQGLSEEEQEQKDEFIPKVIPERVKLGDIWQLGNHKLICADSLNEESYELLFENKKIDCAMSSPPYYGLRDYGVEGQMGLEEHPNIFIEKIIFLTNLIKKHLKSTGSIYYNLGDTYFGSMQGYGQKPGQGSGIQNSSDGYFASSNSKPPMANKSISSNWLQPKQLMLMPSRVAIALQNESYILRNDIVWHKPNPMPSSVKDRLNNTYEHIFHFVVNKKYFYDLDGISEPHKEESIERTKHRWDGHREPGSSYEGMDIKKMCHVVGKNPGDLFEITTQPYSEAHFATYPVRLIEKPIISSCPEWICERCGEIRERITENIVSYHHYKNPKDPDKKQYKNFSSSDRWDTSRNLKGFTKCSCNAEFK